MPELCQLWLTCADTEEASKIVKLLLDEKLIVCAKQVPITSDFLWESKIDHSNEVLLVMDSKLDIFDQVEAEVEKVHSYDIFVLQAIPVVRISKGAKNWLESRVGFRNE